MESTEQAVEIKDPIGNDNNHATNQHGDNNNHHNAGVDHKDIPGGNNHLQTATNDGNQSIHPPIQEGDDDHDAAKKFIINNDHNTKQNFQPELVKFTALNEQISMDIDQSDPTQNMIHETVIILE